MSRRSTHPALFLLSAAILGPACGCLHGQPATGRDHLLGWYASPDGRRVVPVFKRDAAYFSVCRGFEAPLKECPDGLEWALEPSSMTGTTIGFDRESGTYYLAVFDAQGVQFSDGQYGNGQKQQLTRIDQPAWLRDPTTPPPRTLDDFVGWYLPVWFPYMRFEIHRDGEAWTVVYEYWQEASWQPEDGRPVLTPLVDGLGFTGFERGSDIAVAYNAGLQRYELTMPQETGVHMALARIPAPTAADPGAAPPDVTVGIPSWH